LDQHAYGLQCEKNPRALLSHHACRIKSCSKGHILSEHSSVCEIFKTSRTRERLRPEPNRIGKVGPFRTVSPFVRKHALVYAVHVSSRQILSRPQRRQFCPFSFFGYFLAISRRHGHVMGSHEVAQGATSQRRLAHQRSTLPYNYAAAITHLSACHMYWLV